jgi:hypothetical protein
LHEQERAALAEFETPDNRGKVRVRPRMLSEARVLASSLNAPPVQVRYGADDAEALYQQILLTLNVGGGGVARLGGATAAASRGSVVRRRRRRAARWCGGGGVARLGGEAAAASRGRRRGRGDASAVSVAVVRRVPRQQVASTAASGGDQDECRLMVKVAEAKCLRVADRLTKRSDPYVELRIAGRSKALLCAKSTSTSTRALNFSSAPPKAQS